MIKYPLTSGGEIGGSFGLVQNIVNEEIYLLGGPFDRKDVEIIGKTLPIGECIRSSDSRPAGVPRPV